MAHRKREESVELGSSGGENQKSSRLKARKGWRQKRYNFLFSSIN
jgi:hypothetical protein